MLSKKEVQKVAKLARLGLSPKEVKKFQKELSKILDYIEKLKEVDISKVEPTSHPLNLKNVTRKDEKRPGISQQALKLLELAPEIKRGYLKVKSVFK